VKTIASARIEVAGDAMCFEFSADAYLHHMIRNIIGALVHVGAGKAPPPWIGEVLAGRDRARAAPTFAADGLYLTGVDYPPLFTLPSTRRPLAFPHPFPL